MFSYKKLTICSSLFYCASYTHTCTHTYMYMCIHTYTNRYTYTLPFLMVISKAMYIISEVNNHNTSTHSHQYMSAHSQWARCVHAHISTSNRPDVCSCTCTYYYMYNISTCTNAVSHHKVTSGSPQQ